MFPRGLGPPVKSAVMPLSREPVPPRDRALIAAVAAAVAAFLLYRLGGYAGTLLTWEPAVVSGFEKGLQGGMSAWRWAAGAFLWDDGLLSAGHTSLFYGAPTYALFRTIGVGPVTLRLFAVLAAVLSIPLGARIGTHLFGPRAAVPAALVVSLSPPLLFYARYGTSASGMLLSSWIAFAAALVVLTAERPGVRHGLAAAGALYLATLQYAPVRLLVLYLLAFLVGDLLLRPRAGRRAWRALGALLAGILVVLALQVAFGRQGAFLRARGEQFLEMVRHTDYLREYLGRRVDPANVTFSDRLEMATAMVGRTGSQLLDLLSPRPGLPKPGEIVQGDPPILALFAVPLTPFVLWGLVLSVRAARRVPAQLLLLGWPVATLAPLLLTTRVDTHRIAVAYVPFALWAVAGLLAAADLLAAPRALRALRAPLGIVLLGATGFFALRPMIVPRTEPSPLAGLLVEAARGSRPAILAVRGDHTAVGWARLTLLDRVRSRPGFPALVLEERLLNGLGGPTEPPERNAVREVEDLVLDSADIVLAPESEFAAAGRALAAEGLAVQRIETGGIAALKVTKAVSAPSAAAELRARFAPLGTARHVFLSALEPSSVDCSFAPPRMDSAWDGSPISLGATLYERGVGMHAPCAVSWTVPEGAESFQAVVGLQPSARGCKDTAVRFELHDEEDRRIYRSPIVDLASPSLAIVVPVSGVKTLTLVVTEGGNGRDCDHASWAEAAFVMQSP